MLIFFLSFLQSKLVLLKVILLLIWRALLSISWSFSLCEKCLYSDFFWSIFSRIRIEYGEILSVFAVFLVRIFFYLVRIRKNTDQKNSKYGHFHALITVLFQSLTHFVTMISFNLSEMEAWKWFYRFLALDHVFFMKSGKI